MLTTSYRDSEQYGQPKGNVLGGLHHDDGEAEGHSHHTSKEGGSPNQCIRAKVDGLQIGAIGPTHTYMYMYSCEHHET